MKRKYVFNWYKNVRHGEPMIRKNSIDLIKPTGKVEYDAKAALQIFMANFGNLHKNTIISIKELDENGEQIGEDIRPSAEENAIIPAGR